MQWLPSGASTPQLQKALLIQQKPCCQQQRARANKTEWRCFHHLQRGCAQPHPCIGRCTGKPGHPDQQLGTKAKRLHALGRRATSSESGETMTDHQAGPTSEHSANAVVEGLIEEWKMQPHPEGGWYREIHRSSQTVTRSDGAKRAGVTTILFLLKAGSTSRWHQVRHADEVWIHLQGAPLSLWDLPETGGEASRQILSLQQPVQVIPANHWQAARPEGPYSLVSCCVGPGFAFEDFTMLHELPQSEWPEGALTDLV